MEFYTDSDTDHDLCIPRTSRRGREYNVWVKVDGYAAAEPQEHNYPGCDSEVTGATAWTSMHDPVELTADELIEVCGLYETQSTQDAWDAQDRSEDYH